MRTFTSARVARDQLELPARVGFLEHLAVPRPFGDRCLVLVPLEQVVPQRPQQPGLGLESEVDGLEGDVRASAATSPIVVAG